ncbi:hypothetical protein HMPREF1568_1369 [Providencia alcalifaciens PAL-3]|nr:hypothetical protein HMPREF1568_1369 [Providencia alcalifaciens PAL-3]EUC99873.1 hypothetical protein HMPREF1566_3505 [Providencia alcalifaciens PAL-1]
MLLMELGAFVFLVSQLIVCLNQNDPSTHRHHSSMLIAKKYRFD